MSGIGAQNCCPIISREHHSEAVLGLTRGFKRSLRGDPPINRNSTELGYHFRLAANWITGSSKGRPEGVFENVDLLVNCVDHQCQQPPADKRVSLLLPNTQSRYAARRIAWSSVYATKLIKKRSIKVLRCFNLW